MPADLTRDFESVPERVVDENWVVVDENGEPVDLEALAARATPPEEWTLEQFQVYGEQRLGWDPRKLNPAWVELLTDMQSRAFPEQASEFRREADFALARRAAALRLHRAPIGIRPRQREHHPRRRRVASSPRRARAPGRSGDDEPEPPDLAHRHDREVVSAVFKAQRASAGRGYDFQLPPSLREAGR